MPGLSRYAPLWPVLQALGVVALVAWWVAAPGTHGDASNYYSLDLDNPYLHRWTNDASFVYSPAYAQVLYPLTLLPFDAFYRILLAIDLVALGWLLGPVWGAVALLLPPIQSELSAGQIHMLLGVMVVVGMRHPAAWSFGLLSKVTPGIGVLWFAARREWRACAVAIGVTALIVAASALVVPKAWIDWFGLLTESGTIVEERYALTDWPAAFRLPIAAGMVVMAAWRNRPVALPVIVLFALPAIWPWSLSLLAAIPRLIRYRPPTRSAAPSPRTTS